ncbi:copper homeostasis protein CutC [Xylanimonas oleitrophica]|uniref:PF03932 family protein CutC n=1 Tax=Xylanimonas oleitrophica TaxID=2607479 RepID=A0A2W5XRB0_9MICO|nr:copper homeostasis protein CutC [Xylanimonas oleitrophica]PZR52168.1 copper homeostasis protein CutC [Xylanimonas oleitrophica]
MTNEPAVPAPDTATGSQAVRHVPSEVALEIAVQDVAGAGVAAQGGATRVELCAALGATGGLTPSAGTVAAVVDALAGTGVGVHVLVRPRPGGFVYAPEELAVQVRDVRAVLDAGADGVVVGALTDAGRVHAAALAALVDAAGGAEVTFHRAFDVVADRAAAARALAAAGVRRVLTSGGAVRAGAGVDALAALAGLGRGLGLQVMAGGGVRPDDVAALVAAGVDAVHLSARRSVADDGGPGGGADGGYDVTDPGVVAAARTALDAALVRR